MASSFSPFPVETNLSQDSHILSNVSAADLVFYRAVELQTGLIQNYRNAIFNMVVVAADVAGRMPKSAAQEGIKAAKAMTDSRKQAEQAFRTSADNNLGNAVAATDRLMNNCVEALQQLDVIADAALVQCVEMILGAVASA